MFLWQRLAGWTLLEGATWLLQLMLSGNPHYVIETVAVVSSLIYCVYYLLLLPHQLQLLLLLPLPFSFVFNLFEKKVLNSHVHTYKLTHTHTHTHTQYQGQTLHPGKLWGVPQRPRSSCAQRKQYAESHANCRISSVWHLLCKQW